MRTIKLIVFCLVIFLALSIIIGDDKMPFRSFANAQTFTEETSIITVHGAGDGITDDTSAIQSAVDAAGDNTVLLPAGTYKISSNITVPGDVTFWLIGKLSIDVGVTVTIDGKVEAGLYQIFSGAGSVTLAADSCESTYPQWWGAVGDGSNDDTAAIQAALDSAVFVTFLPKGTYKITSALTLGGNHGKRFLGTGKQMSSQIIIYGGGNAIEVVGTRWNISHLRLQPDTDLSGSGIKVSVGKGTVIDNCHIGNVNTDNAFDRGIELSSTCYYTRITNCILRGNNDHVYMWNGGAGNGPNAAFIHNNVMLGGNYSIRNLSGGAMMVTANSFETYATRGILVTGGHPMIAVNKFESTGVQPIELASGVDEARIALNNYGNITDKSFVLDNSGEDYNWYSPAKMVFGYPGQSSNMDQNYGGSLELTFDGADITDLKLQATKGDLQFETTASDKVIELQSETRAIEPFVFTPTGGFGRRGENRALSSEDFSTANWTTTNVTVTTDAAVAPNGRTTADKLESTVSAARANQALNGGAAIDGSVTPVEVRFRVWARTVTGTNSDFAISLRSVSGSTFQRQPDLTTTWRLYEVVHTHSYNEVLNVRVYPSETGTDSVYIWGAHVVYGSDNSAVPYIKTTDSIVSVDSPALVATDAIVAGGDIVARGGFKQTFSFMQNDVSAGQADIQIGVLGLAGNTEYVMPYDGSVIGISIASNAARSTGTLTVEPTINDTGTGLTAELDDNPTQYNSATQTKDTDAFSAGARLGVRITTDGSWAPTTADIVVTVIVEM